MWNDKYSVARGARIRSAKSFRPGVTWTYPVKAHGWCSLVQSSRYINFRVIQKLWRKFINNVCNVERKKKKKKKICKKTYCAYFPLKTRKIFAVPKWRKWAGSAAARFILQFSTREYSIDFVLANNISKIFIHLHVHVCKWQVSVIRINSHGYAITYGHHHLLQS